jgi:pentafunctional AROM polypeptide
MPLLDEVSEHARIIGAVNTIVPQQEGSAVRLIGDNTDWLGLLELIEQNLSSDNERTDASTSLVLGAGGTCRAAVYALHKAGFKTIYLFNRTRPNADKIVASFPVEYNIVPLTSLDAFPGEAPLAVISTIPAQGTATQYQPNEEAGVVVPDSILARADGGVLIDVAYKPKVTPLIDLAQRTAGWTGVPGIQMLLEQGFWQSAMFVLFSLFSPLL